MRATTTRRVRSRRDIGTLDIRRNHEAGREGQVHALVELTVRRVLYKLKGNVGPFADTRKSQGSNVHGNTTLGPLAFEVFDGKLVAAVRVMEVVK